MILEQILDLIGPIIETRSDMSDLDSIYAMVPLDGINVIELVQKSDQEIDEFVKKREVDAEQQQKIFDLLQKIKLENSVDSMSYNTPEIEIEDKRKKIMSYFSSFVEPDRIDINNNEVNLVYKFETGSRLKNKIDDIDAWNEDNVLETLSKKLNIEKENMTIINNIYEYINFINEFEQTNYVSRGQKDCTYELVPSLHRLYSDGFKNHSSQLESVFRQKVLHYDKSIGTKDNEELRAYAQHFGLPTNYLDFTEAHLISLLFAVEEFEYIDNHSIVYFVDALSYNKDIIREEIKLVDFSDKHLKEIKEGHYADKSYFIRVGNSNERIHFQKGCFLKVEPNHSLNYMLQGYTKIAIINKNCKESILKELFNLGINFENIYPDKDNMVRNIKFIKGNFS